MKHKMSNYNCANGNKGISLQIIKCAPLIIAQNVHSFSWIVIVLDHNVFMICYAKYISCL